MAEKPHMTVQCITTFSCNLGVLASVSVPLTQPM